MPLAWAHAEYVKLLRSVRDGRVFDTPPQTLRRYVRTKRRCRLATWRFNNKLRAMHAGRRLRLEVRAPVVVHWTRDEWATAHDTAGRDTSLGLWVADLDTQRLPAGSAVRFTFYWPDVDRWEGVDFLVRVNDAA
jgi:glucoamylase